MNFHPLSIKLLRTKKDKPIYLQIKDEMDFNKFIPLVSLQLDNMTFHVGDIVYFEDTFYVFTLIPSIKLNQYGIESFGFVNLRENNKIFWDLSKNYSSKKQSKIILYSDDMFNFNNSGIHNALNMSNTSYEFVGNPFYMDIELVKAKMNDILLSKHPNKDFDIQLDEIVGQTSTFYMTNFRLPIIFGEHEINLNSLLNEKMHYDNLWYISSTNDWSFRLIVTNYAEIKRLEIINSYSYLAGTIFEFREDNDNCSMIEDVVTNNQYYELIVNTHLENQKQILLYLNKEGSIGYVDKNSRPLKDDTPLIPLRDKFFNILHKYEHKDYNKKILNIIG